MADHGLMTVPDWRTTRKGAKVRVALWLHTEIGPGGSFTKQQLRNAFPSVEQIDRRMRDLRPEGWIIATYREDRSLSVDELRLVSEGEPVWEPGYRSRQQTAVPDKERKAIFSADNYSCVYCGIGGGEVYPDEPLRTAKLMLARLEPLGEGATSLATSCDRCHVGGHSPVSPNELVEIIASLPEEQRERLVTWIRQGSRDTPPEMLIWAQYRRMPRAARLAVEAEVTKS
jgi:hypothetical protein